MSTHARPRPIRLFHFSDIHLAVPKPGWGIRDFGNKRLPGWVNLRWFGRGKQFDNARHIVERLVDEIRAHHPDCLVFSGDASGLGFETEIAQAARILGVATAQGIPGLAVPGNHDYYTRSAAASGHF